MGHQKGIGTLQKEELCGGKSKWAFSNANATKVVSGLSSQRKSNKNKGNFQVGHLECKLANDKSCFFISHMCIRTIPFWCKQLVTLIIGLHTPTPRSPRLGG
jgi:hypothetical protein